MGDDIATQGADADVEYRLSHVLVSVPEGANADARDAARKRADEELRRAQAASVMVALDSTAGYLTLEVIDDALHFIPEEQHDHSLSVVMADKADIWDDMVQRYGRRLGIPEEELHPHAFRHLFGTELTEDDVSLASTQDLMGHVDPKSTSVYIQLAQRRKAAVIDKAAPLAKMRTPVSDLLKRLPPG